MSGSKPNPHRLILATLIAIVGLMGLSTTIAVAGLPDGTESSEIVVQNAGPSAATFNVQYAVPGSSPTVLAGVAPGGSRLIPLASGVTISSSQPIASILTREIKSAGAFANHSYSINNSPTQASSVIALPILLNDFSSERWNSRYSVINMGSTVACIKVTYYISASLTSVPVGQSIVDNPSGQSGCASGYALAPGSTLNTGDSPAGARPFPAQTANTQMAALIEVTNPSATNAVAALVDIYRSDGARLLASYNGFLVNNQQPSTDDVGTDVVMPLAIKHSSGYYSVIGVQNLGSVATNVNIRYIGQTESGTPVDQTVVLPAVTNVGFHSTFDTSNPIPIDFVGYAIVTSAQPVAAVLVRAKQTSYHSGINEPVYTAVNGVPRDRGATNWNAPMVYRRVHEFATDVIGWSSWLQVQVADGSSAAVTVRMVGTPGSGCPVGPYETTYQVTGSMVIYQNADSLNGFPASQSPACFMGGAQVSGTKPLIVIANVSSDSYPGGDNEALYNAVPLANGCAPKPDQVALFIDDDFGGYCVLAELGEYGRMNAVSFPDNALSSVKVGGNVQLALFEHETFEGESTVYYGNADTLSNEAIGEDRTSSFKVQARSFSTTGCQPGASEVALFVDANYGGYCITKGVGQYSDISAAGFPNDALSSVKVGKNVSLVAFAGTDFEGDYSIIGSNTPSLTGSDLGSDRASSIKVQVRNANRDCWPGPGEISLFVDQDFGGPCVTKGLGDYGNMSVAGFPDDALTSLRVGSDAEIVVYEHAGYLGASTTYRRNISSVSEDAIGDNLASSFKIRVRNENSDCQPGANQVALFADVNFGGFCVVKGIGEYANMSEAGFPNDALSSVRVGENVQLVAYANINFQGTSSLFAEDAPSLPEGSLGAGRTSSFTVQARGLDATGCVPAPDKVALFDAADYGGGCISAGIGEYPNGSAIGFPGDRLSSVLFASRPPGATGGIVEIVLYQFSNFEGASTVLRNSSPTLIAYAIGNNRASSFKIREATCIPGPQNVALFVDTNGGGDCVVLGAGEFPDLAAIGFPNDGLSSITVGCAVEITLYDDANLRGQHRTYRGLSGKTESLVPAEEDRASSVAVRPAGSGSCGG